MGTIIIREYNYDEIVDCIEKAISQCHADDWPSIAKKLSRISFWEFDDYQPR